MSSEIVFSFDRPVEASDYQALADQTDWAQDRMADYVSTALGNCYLVIGAWIEDRLVGVGRIISDGVYNAQVIDVIVDKEYRLQGIGTEMMRRILARCSSIEVVSLNCGPEQVPFYERLGFKSGHRMSRRSG